MTTTVPNLLIIYIACQHTLHYIFATVRFLNITINNTFEEYFEMTIIYGECGCNCEFNVNMKVSFQRGHPSGNVF